MIELNFKSYGHGPALIILHGLLGSLDNWVSHGRSLSDQYSVFLLDQRNHGRSLHLPEFNYEVLAQDLAEFLDSQGIFRTHILGHSMGGKTAMQFAHEHPERVEKLIVVDMAPKGYPPHHNEVFAALKGVNLHGLSSRQDANTQLARGISDERTRQFLLKSLGRTSGRDYSWKFNFYAIYTQYARILEEIDVDPPFDGPALFLSGGASDYVTEQDQEEIRSKFPKAQFVSMPGLGHWLHADDPEGFLKEVRVFLEE